MGVDGAGARGIVGPVWLTLAPHALEDGAGLTTAPFVVSGGAAAEAGAETAGERVLLPQPVEVGGGVATCAGEGPRCEEEAGVTALLLPQPLPSSCFWEAVSLDDALRPPAGAPHSLLLLLPLRLLLARLRVLGLFD